MHRTAAPNATATEYLALEERNTRPHVIEYLELASSYEAQRRYEADVQDFVDVPREVIEIWADCFAIDPRKREFTGAYSHEEVRAIREFHATWDAVATAMLPRCGTLSEVQALPEWERLRSSAEVALRSSAVRKSKKREAYR